MKKEFLALGAVSLLLPMMFLLQKQENKLGDSKLIFKSNESAAHKGFSVDSRYSYIEDYEESEQRALYNGKRYYGKYSMWNATYKYYSSEADTMYYLCLSVTEIEPNYAHYWDIHGWYNQKMQLKTSVDYEYAKVLAYTPTAYEQDTTSSWSIGFNASVTNKTSVSVGKDTTASDDVSSTIGITSSYSESTTYPSVSASVNTEGLRKNNIIITYNFNRYKKDDKKDCCHSKVTKKYMVLFYIENYSFHSAEKWYVSYTYTPTIFRDGVFNDTSLSPSEPLVHQAKVN